MDILSIIGVLLGFGAILIGQQLEGGHLSTLINGPAALIVLGGTIGAGLIQTPMATFVHAVRSFKWIFMPPTMVPEEAIEKIIEWSNIARREGLLGLEAASETEDDLFARKGLQLLVDGSEPETIRAILETEVSTKEEFEMRSAKVWEGMGGYAPTIGIIGAVMGLIHVMGNLSDPSQLGSGIAVAFVATIYGIGSANLILIPAGNKLKIIAASRSSFREMIMEGIISIAEGENPRNIEVKLQGYLPE
ncbi:MAG: flagellar motor protein [Gammaproteobacteria bacterium]|nr:flagellar motor protein [Gammaproteobacteria bacterium]